MKRVWGHVLAGVTLLAGGVALMASCSKHDDSSLFVDGVLSQPLVNPGQQCLFTDDPTQPVISSGVLDIGLRTEYDAEFLLGNQLVPQVNSQQLQTETDIIDVQGAVVTIDDSAGNQLAQFTRLSATVVYPSSGGVPGYAPLSLTIVDQGTISADTALQANVTSGGITRLVTWSKFFGYTSGGDYVESDNFEFAVDVCYGCLVVFSAADENPNKPLPNCLLAAANSSTATSVASPCVVGQDSAVDCAQCLSDAVCQGAGGAIVPVTDGGTEQ